MVRCLPIIAVVLTSCVDPDFAGERFQCNGQEACPPGRTCVNGFCEPEPTIGDDGGGLPDAFKSDDGAVGDPTMASVPAGSFMMGCNEAIDSTCDSDELPTHLVNLDAFQIDLLEVTQSDYQECIDASACSDPSSSFSPASTPNRPVSHVTWDQATEYCQFRGKRLPTEAEWEMAARGTDGRIWPWGNTPPDCARANFDRCIDDLVDVGTYPTGASPFGAQDMAGNVSEWVNDRFDANYYQSSPADNPPGPTNGNERSIRGSSYAFGEQSVRATNRISGNPNTDNFGRGFRCAR